MQEERKIQEDTKMIRQESERFRTSIEQRGLIDLLAEIKKEGILSAIGGIGLERSGPNGTIYTEEDFADFFLDDKSLEIAEILANGPRFNHPVLIEGEMDIGKTTAVKLLSFLTNTRVLRVPLSSQTDFAEFKGKWVPDIRTQGSWWQDGVVPRAMQWNNGEGCWLYLERISATRPENLVALRPMLDENPRFPINEGVGEHRIWEVIGGPRFRVIASNPSECFDWGWAPLAPDLLRRFHYCIISGLTEEQLVQRLNYLFRNEDKGEQIARVLAEFHFKAAKLLKEGRIRTDERVAFTFSDLVRAKEFIAGSSNPKLLEVLQEAVSFSYCEKLWEESEREMLREEFLTTVGGLHGIDDETERRVRVDTSNTKAKAKVRGS